MALKVGFGRRKKASPRSVRKADPHAIATAVGPDAVAFRYDMKTRTTTIFILEAKGAHPRDPSPNVEMPLARFVLISHLLRARDAFRSDLEMAETLGIDRTRLIAWKRGSSHPRQEQVRFLADVAAAVDTLLRFLHPTVIADWLATPQFQLGDRTPVEALREGRLADVLQAANATEHGAYI